MSNDIKPGNQPPPAAPKVGEPIRVSELRFHSDHSNGVNLGPPFTINGTTHVVQARKIGDDETRIQYEPWLRRHRVSYFKQGKLDAEVCIPESWVIYREERHG